jgi:hypothetical protein
MQIDLINGESNICVRLAVKQLLLNFRYLEYRFRTSGRLLSSFISDANQMSSLPRDPEHAGRGDCGLVWRPVLDVHAVPVRTLHALLRHLRRAYSALQLLPTSARSVLRDTV